MIVPIARHSAVNQLPADLVQTTIAAVAIERQNGLVFNWTGDGTRCTAFVVDRGEQPSWLFNVVTKVAAVAATIDK